MKYFEIKKSFQGGFGIYYAKLPEKWKVKKDCWDKQLEAWGDCSNGGWNYGWRIKARRIKKAPKFTRRNTFEFDKRLLEPNKGRST